MKANKEYDISREMLDKMRGMVHEANRKPLKSVNILLEEKNNDKDNSAIAITNEPRFGQNVLQNEIDSFKETVHGGAKFAAENSKEATENPLVYFPDTGNLVFSGSIPSLANLKFQYSLNDITGAPYIFVDGLAITDDVSTTINKLCGHFKNWKDKWFAGTDLLERLKTNK